MDLKPTTIDLKTRKPRVFIGSSKEALKYAEAIKAKLQDVAAVNIWNEDIWRPGQATLENLINLLPGYDFAVLILGGEDVTSSRGTVTQAPRDNVIFELGLFMGQLGRLRTFFLCRNDTDLKIPSDLKGINYTTFEGSPAQANKAVANACKTMRREIRSQGVLNSFPSGAWTDRFRLASWEEIYSRSIELVSRAESRVRATSFGMPHGLEGLKREYFETLAKRAGEQKNRKIDFIYKVVLTARKRDLQRDTFLRDRKEVFEKYNAFDCLQAREIKDVWRTDFLIVDNKSLLLCFQRTRDNSLALGLQIVEAEELVGPIATWYDECLFDNAKALIGTICNPGLKDSESTVHMSEYLFVYGSLITKGSDGKLNLPVTVNGLRRGWFTAVPQDAITALGAILDQNRSCNGVLIQASDEYLQSTDDREIPYGYRRVKLPRDWVSPWDTYEVSASDIWVYLTDTPTAPTLHCPIAQSYLDVVLTGCLEIGTDFAAEFVRTTDGWDGFWMNDRAQPKYRRHISADAGHIDNLLSSLIPNEFENRLSATK